MFRSRNIITAIEIGTSKVCVLIGSTDENGDMCILGHGERPLRLASGASSPGAVCKGEILEMNEVAMTVVDAVRDAEDASGRVIDRNNLFLAVTGTHIQSTQGRGVVHIRTLDRKVTDEHVALSLEGATNLNLQANLRLINSFDSYYLLDDDSRRVANPVGQVANKLEAVVHHIYGNANRIDSTVSALHEVGYDSDAELVFSIVAASYGVLTESEKEEGVLLIDIGAGTTEFLMLQNSGIQTSGILPVGTEHIANDLHVAFGLSIDESRKMARHRDLFNLSQSKNAYMTAPARDGRRSDLQIPIHAIEKVIDLRVREIITMIQVSLEEELSKQSIRIPVVLIGGGAMHPYIPDIISGIFNVPVRIGEPQNVAGTTTNIRSPSHGMICGLLVYGDMFRKIDQSSSANRMINTVHDYVTKPVISFTRSIFGGLKI